MHGWMQNSSVDEPMSQIGDGLGSQMDLVWNILHCERYLCSVAPLVAPEINLWCDLPTSMWQINLTRGYSYNNHFQNSRTNTYQLYRFCSTPSNVDSMVLVQRAWKKFWPVHMLRIAESTPKSWLISNRFSGRSGRWHPRQIWFSKIPNSLAHDICWSSAGSIPQERILVKVWCIVFRREPGSSNDDFWITLQSMS